jgi:hypothetical protein
MKNKSTILILLIVSIALISPFVAADATVDIKPAKPKALDSIEITATITDENIISVYTTIQECNENTGICYAKDNNSMTSKGADQYTASIDLTHSDATYLQYTIHVQTNDGWVEYQKDTKVNYDTSSNGGSNNDNDTPGFEFVVLALSIMFISLLAYRRTR